MRLDCTRAQLQTAYQVTLGYNEDNTYEFYIATKGVLYLTVINVVYVIDREGRYETRNKNNGQRIEAIYESPRRIR